MMATMRDRHEDNVEIIQSCRLSTRFWAEMNLKSITAALIVVTVIS
jgi:hypothetical protein